MKNIGQRIKTLRLDHGMTLQELGKEVQFNYSNLSKIERGCRMPSVELLSQLAQLYNVEISYFFEEKEYSPNNKLSY
ncbi:helix-turn-helix domain-containing protein [Fictibacillus enclensis]|uniref:helix-turn-helix domain-containing protein n=1 Tax=Fictibacillus enclensis TaxID=1017270 RepID=UPI0024BFED86|nr:helix-turn-helix transcriptional regulator [Fictibacillus enclensis]WHY71050.1 helix-turn-helix transcriptional regulator [Fictibacillus enclensis]